MRLLLFTLLFSSFVHSQKFDGYVVTNANDTINCKYFVPTNMFDKTLVEVASIKDEISIYNKGERVKYTSKDLKSFLIKGTKFGDLKFVSFKYDDYNRFYHEVIVGKLMYYRYYLSAAGAPVFGIGFGLKDEKFVELQGPDVREKLGEFIIDFPELHAKWMNPKIYKTKKLEEVIKLYNEYFKN